MFNIRKVIAVLVLLTFSWPVNTATAIVGPDREVFNNEAVWTARLSVLDPNSKEEYTVCSGVLISKSIVVTAAHCLDPYNGIDFFESLKITLGAHHQEDPNMITRKAISVVYHNRYFVDDESYDNDIAIVVLDNPVSSIKPVKLPKKGYKLKGALRTYGWGQLDNAGNSTTKLLTAQQFDLSEDLKTLNRYSPYYNYKHTKVIAATAIKDGVATGTCYGDSGGPLVDAENVLVGLTSWADAELCNEPVATIFTKVSEYLSWISEATTKAELLHGMKYCESAASAYYAKEEALELISSVRKIIAERYFTTYANFLDITRNEVKLLGLGGKFESGRYTTSYGVTYEINFKKGKISLGDKYNSPTYIKKYKSKVLITGYYNDTRNKKTSKLKRFKDYSPTICSDPLPVKTQSQVEKESVSKVIYDQSDISVRCLVLVKPLTSLLETYPNASLVSNNSERRKLEQVISDIYAPYLGCNTNESTFLMDNIFNPWLGEAVLVEVNSDAINKTKVYLESEITNSYISNNPNGHYLYTCVFGSSLIEMR